VTAREYRRSSGWPVGRGCSAVLDFAAAWPVLPIETAAAHRDGPVGYRDARDEAATPAPSQTAAACAAPELAVGQLPHPQPVKARLSVDSRPARF
jgi:hypothetical protein